MIGMTYLEFYGKFKDQFNPDEFIELIKAEDLIERFGSFLESGAYNILTPVNMPWFDLGDIPTTHSFMRNETSQVYYIPQNRNPDSIFIKYSFFRPLYICRDPQERYDRSSLPGHEVSFENFKHTMELCTVLLKNYKGKL